MSNFTSKLILTILLSLFIFNLDAFAQKAELVVQTGHADSIRSMTFSPDGKLLASVGNDNTVIVWEVASGQELRTFSGHHTAITAVAFSPNGKLLATISHAEHLIKVWNIETAQELWNSESQEERTSREVSLFPSDQRHSISFSPDGQYLAVGKDRDNNLPQPPLPMPKPMPPNSGESSEDYNKRKEEFYLNYQKSVEMNELVKHSIEIWSIAKGIKVKELLGNNSDVPFV